MRKTKPEYEKAILSAKKRFIAIAGKTKWNSELDFFLAWLGTKELYACDPESMRQSILNVAHTGVSLNPIYKEAYLIERDGKCFLSFTFRGLTSIAISDGVILSINANPVYKWDTFDFREGTDSFLHHKKSVKIGELEDRITKDPKTIWEHVTCAYAIAKLPNSGGDVFIVLPKWKLIKTWTETSAHESSINQMFPEEWIRKTAVIYLASKNLPHARKMVQAISVINEHEGIKKTKSKSRLLMRMNNDKK